MASCRRAGCTVAAGRQRSRACAARALHAGIRCFNTARGSHIVGKGFDLGLFTFFQQDLDLLFRFLQGLLAVAGEGDAALEMLERLFQAEVAVLHFSTSASNSFSASSKAMGDFFFATGHTPRKARHVNLPPPAWSTDRPGERGPSGRLSLTGTGRRQIPALF